MSEPSNTSRHNNNKRLKGETFIIISSETTAQHVAASNSRMLWLFRIQGPMLRDHMSKARICRYVSTSPHSCFLHFLIKSVSPSVSFPPSFSFSLSLVLSISLVLSLPYVTPRLQLIDDERNLSRTGALLKTGQCVLSAGASGEMGGLQREEHQYILLLYFLISFSSSLNCLLFSVLALPSVPTRPFF